MLSGQPVRGRCAELGRTYHTFGQGERTGVCSVCGYVCTCRTCEADRARAIKVNEARVASHYRTRPTESNPS